VELTFLALCRRLWSGSGAVRRGGRNAGMTMEATTLAVAMSGGVDSSTVAAMLAARPAATTPSSGLTAAFVGSDPPRGKHGIQTRPRAGVVLLD